ncbi:hypothetical protein KC845_03560 [Candidatus Kaiserbacteria bacterium]|nr:hypothetical protein [Candidatus Kaiserbacteria bacterium]
MIRIVSSIIILLMILSGWLVPYVIANIVFALRYTGYELIVIAGLIDAYFAPHDLPYYLFFVVLLVVFVEWLKPKLTLYNK